MEVLIIIAASVLLLTFFGIWISFKIANMLIRLVIGIVRRIV